MSRSWLSICFALFLIWAIVMPFGFVALYSAIEMQGAARAASKLDDRLATLRTIDLARQLDAADASGERSSLLAKERRKALIDLFQSRADARSSAIDLMLKHGETGVTELCTAPPADLKTCQIDENLATCTTDWMKIAGCYEKAMHDARNSSGDAADVADLKNRMRQARLQGSTYNQIAERIKAANILETDPLRPVAEAYRTIKIPLIHFFFELPQGVVVASFTCLMAAIGSGVSSLMGFITIRSTDKNSDDLLRSFLLSPLLGGLTGFMVYFVVSAGTSFLVQPAPADPSQATTSNLSAPALAALGVLAGLAAESAIAWLQKKAGAFFQS